MEGEKKISGGGNASELSGRGNSEELNPAIRVIPSSVDPSHPQQPREQGLNLFERSILEDFSYAGNERIKIFAQGLFPEELSETKLEGWNSKRGLEFFTKIVNGFAASGFLSKEEHNLTNKCIGILSGAQSSIVECENFNKSYDGLFVIIKRHLEANSQNFNYQLLKELVNDKIPKNIAKKIHDDVIQCSSRLWNASYNENFCRKWARELSFILSPQPKSIYDKLINDGCRIYLSCGWIANNHKGHCAYVVLENKGGKIYAHEINSGGGLVRSFLERNKSGVYVERGTPGCTIEFKNEKETCAFIADSFELQRFDADITFDNREGKYRRLWDHGTPIKHPSWLGRPCFTEAFQRSGNCVVQSTSILIRTELQCAMAKAMGVDVNDRSVVRKTNQLYRLYTIYFRAQLLRSYLDWIQANPDSVDRDSLDMLRRGVGRFGHYIMRYKKKITDQEKQKFLSCASQLEKSVNEYLNSMAAMEIANRSKPHREIALGVSPQLSEEAKAFAVQYVQVEHPKDSKPELVEHTIVELESIESNPERMLSYMQYISNNVGKLSIKNRSCAACRRGSVVIDMRQRELIHGATELLRVMPLPGTAPWEAYASNLSEKQRYELVFYMYNIFSFFMSIPAVKGYLTKGMPEECISEIKSIESQILDRWDTTFHNSELVPIFNAITKMRIVTFCLAQKDPQLASCIPANCYVDHSCFISFCKSGINFTINEADLNEQTSLFNYVTNAQTGKPLFGYVVTEGSSKNLVDDSTLTLYDSIARQIIGSDTGLIENCLPKGGLPLQDILRINRSVENHPGLLLLMQGGEEICRSLRIKFVQDVFNREVSEFLEGLKTTLGNIFLEHPILEEGWLVTCAAFLKQLQNLYNGCALLSDDGRAAVVRKKLASLNKSLKKDIEELPKIEVSDGEKVGYAKWCVDKLTNGIPQAVRNSISCNLYLTLPDFLRHFHGIMAYWPKHIVDSDKGYVIDLPSDSLKVSKGVSLIGNSIEALGGGYALNSENDAHVLAVKNSTNQLQVIDLIGEEASRPNVQSVGLLRLLGDHLEVCEGFHLPFVSTTHVQSDCRFYDDDDASEAEKKAAEQEAKAAEQKRMKELCNHPSFLFNLWLQLFNRVLYPEQHATASYQITSPTAPIREEAVCHPYVLLGAVNALWEKGRAELWENIPDRRPNVRQLCALLHIAHIVYHTVVTVERSNPIHGLDEILSMAKSLLENRLTDIARMRENCKDSLTSDEGMYLRLVENECIADLIDIAQRSNERVANELLFMLCNNTFFLHKFDCSSFPKGCSEIIFGFIPKLAWYWKKYPDQGKYVAERLYDSLATSKRARGMTEKGVGRFSAGNGHFVDLINLKIYDAGNELQSTVRIFEHPDYRRLFSESASHSREITSVGNIYRLNGTTYGDIVIHDVKIFRQFIGSGSNWRYISSGIIRGEDKREVLTRLPLQECFGGDDFTVWASAEGNIRICPKNNPNEILYETDTDGRLCDVRRRDQGIEPCYVAFHDYTQAEASVDEFSRFEGKKYTLFYHSRNGEIQEVAFPRYVDSSGKMLRLVRKENGWVLASNQNYRLIDAPSWSSGNQANLLQGYDGVLWLENVDQKCAGVVKCLLPDVNIGRDLGMTHDVRLSWLPATNEHTFFGSARYAEASLYTDELGFVGPSLQANNALGSLRLAHIFQTQGEYELALQCLDNLSTRGKFSPDEVAMLKRIVRWFNEDVGHEQNGLVALVVIKALSRMLESSPFGEDSKKILYEIVKSENQSLGSNFQSLVKNYLIGFDLYPQALQLNFRGERIFWETIKMLVPTLESVAHSIGGDAASIRSGMESYFSSVQTLIDGRLTDLNILIAKEDTVPLSSSLKQFSRANMPFVVASTRNSSNVPEVGGSTRGVVQESHEKAVWDELNRLNIFGITSTHEDATRIPFSLGGASLTDVEQREFGKTAETFFTELGEELNEGARQLQRLENGPATRTIPQDSDIEKLQKIIASQKSTAIASAKRSATEIDRIGNDQRAEKTYGADTWDRLKIPNALRAYGMFSSGSGGRKRALEYLKTNFPWFSEENLDDFFAHTENYLMSVNSARHLEKTESALESLTTPGVSDEKKRGDWCNALQILRQTRGGTSIIRDGDGLDVGAKNELVRNMLLFEYMTGIRPREDQVEKILFIVKTISAPDGSHGALIQQIMGSGKTKVLLPFLITLLFNRNNNLPIVISHISQLPAVMLEMPAILRGVGIRMDAIDMDYGHFSTPRAICLIRERLEMSFDRRNSVPVFDSHTLLALRTAFRALSDSASNEMQSEVDARNALYVEFNRLFTFLEQHGIAVMDEVHITLNPKESFIIQPPSSGNTSDRIPAMDVTFMVDLIYGIGGTLISAIRANTSDQIPVGALKAELIKYVCNKYGAQFNISENLRENFAKFVCGKFDGVNAQTGADEFPDALKKWLDDMTPVVRHQVSLLRKLCSSTLIQCLSKTYGEHYGYNANGEVVPYRNYLPTNSHYKDSHEKLCYFILATIINGVHPRTLSSWVEQLAVSAKSQTNSSISFGKTNPAVLFEKLFEGQNQKLTLIDAVNMRAAAGKPKVRPEILPRMQDFLKSHPGVMIRIVENLAQDQSSYFSRSYEATPLCLADSFHGTISMSGTLSNKDSYVTKVRSAMDLQTGALGKIMHKLVEDEKTGKTKIVAVGNTSLSAEGMLGQLAGTVGAESDNTSLSVEGMLGQWAGTVGAGSDKVKNLRLIVDYAAQFKDQSIRQSVADIAQFIVANGNGAKYIEYFDPKRNGFAIVSIDDVQKNGIDFTPKDIIDPSADRPRNSEELFTFLDFPRATGTDPLMMANGHGITSVNLFQGTIDGFTQAVMRERKFLNLNGQTMDIVFPKQAEAGNSDMNTTPSVLHLLNRLARNTAQDITRQRIQATTLLMRELPRQFIEKKLREQIAQFERRESYDARQNFQRMRVETATFMATVDDFNPDIWADRRNWQKAREIFQQQWDSTVGQLSNIFSSQDISTLKGMGQAYINQIEEEIQMLTFSSQGMLPVAGQEMQVQTEREQQQEQQQQQQQQQQQELETELETELESLHQFFHGSRDRTARREADIVEPDRATSAWSFMVELPAKSLATKVRDEQISTAEMSPENKAKYDAVRNIFPKSLNDEFFMTENFLATTNADESVFSSYQKDVKYLLLSWDNSRPPKQKCHFLSEYEAESIRSMIEGGRLTDCHLCTSNGVPVVDNKPINKKFLEKSIWMAHFFNADVQYMDAHSEFTEEMFIAFGMPAIDQEMEDFAHRSSFLANIRNFLVLRSADPKKTAAYCANSTLISYGSSKDTYACFLAEHALTNMSPANDILSAIDAVEDEQLWKTLILRSSIDPNTVLRISNRLHDPKNTNTRNVICARAGLR
ncbi:MAG: hypothetical protein LBQ23_03445 [Puniceicoccales bacterium]|jgi:hypothetical protein|nr:hypothetical protein [Puniceicoccales bacterium]